jgi:hypothetical protein
MNDCIICFIEQGLVDTLAIDDVIVRFSQDGGS